MKNIQSKASWQVGTQILFVLSAAAIPACGLDIDGTENTPSVEAQGLVSVASAGTTQAFPPGTTILNANLLGKFAFVPCPPGTDPTVACLRTDVSGTEANFGNLTGNFFTFINPIASTRPDCSSVVKFGSLIAQDGSKLRIVATGCYHPATGIANYYFNTLDGGTGRFNGAVVQYGQYTVPAATSFDGTKGEGRELVTGLLRI